MSKRYDVMCAKETNGKNWWTKVGVAFENKNGTGYNLMLDYVPAPIDGQYRFSLLEPNENSGYKKDNSYSNTSSGRPGTDRGNAEEDEIPF